MIAFLEEVRAEGGGMLRMLQVAPSSAVERYALSREDIWYESTDLVREDPAAPMFQTEPPAGVDNSLPPAARIW